MAKAYWVARVDVTNPDAYKDYVASNGVAFAKYGARFLVRGGKFECVVGTSRSRNVVIEFKDYETAMACWNSPEYQAARAKQGNPVIDCIVIEGYEGAQPGESA